MRTLIMTALILPLLLACVPPVEDPPDCWDTATPAGALPDQPPPVFCDIVGAGPGTAVSGPNSWVDDFDHGLSFASFEGAGYTAFDTIGRADQSVHWRHADHWMVDLSPDSEANRGEDNIAGALLRPNQTFQFDDGKLVIETEFAAGIDAYASGDFGRAWGGIDITTAAAPDPEGRTGATYGYDFFPGSYTLGCRFQSDSHVTCSLNDDSDRTFQDNSRIWEMSFFQHVGTTTFGGADFVGDGSVFDECAGGEPDSECRSLWRMELTETSLSVFIDDQLYFEQTGIPPLPSELFDGDLYVYASSMAGSHDADTIRFHWDRFAVNPDS